MFLEYYDRLPWQLRASVPHVLILFILRFYYKTFHLNFLEILGVTFCLLSTLCWLMVLYHIIYRNWIGVALGHSADLTKFGSWAVITGSTQGIGLAYAHALAKKGLNVVLLSRSPEKLSEAAQEIMREHQVQVKVIAMDFTGGVEIYDHVEKELENLDVGILINNVGMCYPYPEYFADLPGGRKFCQDLINCNISSVAQMTHIVLPGMVERKGGVVVNVGSFSAIIDVPYLSLYGSSKAFVDKFTQDLDLEYRQHGIIFQSVIPGYVTGTMSKIRASTMWVPTPEDFVEGALNAVGLQKRTAVWLPHQLFHLIVKVGHFFRRDGACFVSR